MKTLQMKEVIISNPLYPEGQLWRGKKATLVCEKKDIVVVTGLSGTYGKECIFFKEEVTIL